MGGEELMLTVKHSAIFDYWKDKFITKSGKVLTYDELTALRDAGKPEPSYPVVLDWGEIECWACGRTLSPSKEADLQKRCSMGDDFNYEKLWNAKEVQSFYNRCHIVPAALGGPDAPENLFLLCPQCHVISPDTVNYSAFIRWVFNCKDTHRFGWPLPEVALEAVDRELADRGLPDARTIVGEGVNISYDLLLSYAKTHMVHHAGEHMSMPTLAVLLADYLEENYNFTIS